MKLVSVHQFVDDLVVDTIYAASITLNFILEVVSVTLLLVALLLCLIAKGVSHICLAVAKTRHCMILNSLARQSRRYTESAKKELGIQL